MKKLLLTLAGVCIAVAAQAAALYDKFTVDGMTYLITSLDPPEATTTKPDRATLGIAAYEGTVTFVPTVEHDGVTYTVEVSSQGLGTKVSGIRFVGSFTAKPIDLSLTLTKLPNLAEIQLPVAACDKSCINVPNGWPVLDIGGTNDGTNLIFTVQHNVRNADGTIARPYLALNPDYKDQTLPKKVYADENGRITVPLSADGVNCEAYDIHKKNDFYLDFRLYFDTDTDPVIIRTDARVDDAAEIEQDNLRYMVGGGEAIVLGFLQEPTTDSSLVIPSTVTYAGKVYHVTKVNSYSFMSCMLASIDLGNIREIGWQAFSSNLKLTFIDIPPTVEKIGYGAFLHCGITALNLGQVKEIEDKAFAHNPGLTSVDFPSTVEKIGAEAFADCGLTVLRFAEDSNLKSAGLIATDIIRVNTHPVENGEMTVDIEYEVYVGDKQAPITIRTGMDNRQTLEGNGSITLTKSSMMWGDNYNQWLSPFASINQYSLLLSNIISIPEALWETDAVGDVAVDGADAPAEYFTLQGVRVENPSAGVYIRRRGARIDKVMMR